MTNTVQQTASGRVVKPPTKFIIEQIYLSESEYDSDYIPESESDFDSDDESYADSESDSDDD